jgi:type VI secretion system protein ImpG
MTDDVFMRYFDGEMRYLKEAGSEFASQFQDIARELGLDSNAGPRDGSVERLFQGFAFLMARIRQKIDDDIPELTEPLLAHLLPIVNRTLPSTAVVEMTPGNANHHTRDQRLEAGSEILTTPIITTQEGRGERCPYRTTRPLVIHPFTLDNITHFTRRQGQHALRLRFVISPLADRQQIDWQNLPLFINGDRVLQSALYLALSRQVHSIWVRYQGDTEQYPFSGNISPQWHATEASIWPHSDSPLMCGEVRPWLEYFTGPARYFFINLQGLETLHLAADCYGFELEVVLDKPLPPNLAIPPDALRMHCVPLINLFHHLGEPLSIDPAVLDYRLRPHRLHDGHTEIYSVDSVSQKLDNHQTYQYVPYSQFRGKGGMLKYQNQWPERFYHTRMWRGPSGLNETLLMLGGRSHEKQRQIQEEARLRLNMTCTNGAYPRMALQQAIFDQQVATGNLLLQVTTRGRAELPAYPPNTPRYQWQVMSLLHPQALDNLLSPAVLKKALALFEWSHTAENQRRIAGISDLQAQETQRVINGQYCHGVNIHITLDENCYSGPGDALLFSEILEQFFTQYADIRCFTQFNVTLMPSATPLAWPERHPQRILM